MYVKDHSTCISCFSLILLLKRISFFSSGVVNIGTHSVAPRVIFISDGNTSHDDSPPNDVRIQEV